ncbi:uncharacterized protein N7503_005490 [Penicillium pulvis]|uniref:uncharacterized protein n=1 Tax=Penicillium pulvis TaxID=1562058 RepID=UPI0025487322|nr:uncharacterized protein N7503_005490 [Penicillium pulvis]KAJ5803040.1 hypothetical protein N7503_005490 [Penicillium pulvis]
MDAQPLTLSESHKIHSSIESTPTSSPASPDVRSSAGTWSLKRLLSGRGSRRYRVLEREPNRLRKRVSQ